ncbi:class I SAM-dependent methyltransferase [Streptomyces sp. NPDC091212]|uniref:class I SAM-dependent methyltransferase n=1 Tax=Streptomyces sp. NPDC091212 TaxID=3155191 RepID=UPI003428FE78
MGLSMATAESWVRRWELQQARYAVDREERFSVIADVVGYVTREQSRPYVVDLGCGPGSLAARMAARLPRAEIVAADMDPLLLELARTHHPDAARYVDVEIGEEGWTAALELDRPLDAAVSTTALHYLSENTLRRTYAQLAAALRPGGVLINADHLPQRDRGGRGGAAHSRITEHVGRCRAQRQRAFAHEDWDAWWAAVADDPELTDLLAERGRRGPISEAGEDLPPQRHAELLRHAGFEHAAPVWQFGDSYVLVAIR